MRAFLVLALTGMVATVAPWAQAGENPIVELAKKNVSDPNKPFTMVVYLTVKADEGKKLEEAFKPAIAATRKEKGCIAYDLNREAAEPTKYYVYERWQSIAALERHMETDHIQALLGKIKDLLSEAPNAKFFQVVGE